MSFDWWTLALQAANFLILVALLQYFLYRPVLAVIDRRQQETERLIADANAAKAAAGATQAELESERRAIAREREGALQDAYQRAQDEVAKVLAEAARKEADRRLAEARAQMAREREEAGSALRDRAIDLAVEMARRLLADVADRTLTEALLERTVARLRALPERDRQELAAELADGVRVSVVTAQPLDDRAAERCRAALCEVMGGGTAVEFFDDPALLAGVELHFPHSVMRGSWRDSLEAITQELKRDDRPARVA
jgi:F-type H+-transporting ATPase subunit b